jgi:imidazoleglycerol-phosphate dehydratase
MRLKEREATVKRETKETSVELSLNLDGNGEVKVKTGISFLDHILGAFATHGLFNLGVLVQQERRVDKHHVVEDVAICLGMAIESALGEKRGIRRFGHAIIPMDDALALVSIDLCGRDYLAFNARFKRKDVGDLPLDLIPHFLRSLSSSGRFVLHAYITHGRDDHHKIEALFKALGVAMRDATRIERRLKGGVPSQKGVLR